MATVHLSVSPREGTGKSVTRKLRADGKFPAVLYGNDETPTNLTVDAAEFRRCISTGSGIRAVFNLDLEGTKKVAILKDLQRHPLSQQFLHADLMAIRLDEPIEVTVPISPVGVAPGVKLEGGVLAWGRRDLDIRVLPTQIPESVEVDISELHINDSIHVSDLSAKGLPFEILQEPERAICSISSARLQVESADEPEADEAEGEGDAEGGDESASE